MKPISADSHVVEPADLWQSRLDARFRDRAPEVVVKQRGDKPIHLFVAEGPRPFPVATGFSKASPGWRRRFLSARYRNAFPSPLSGSSLHRT